MNFFYKILNSKASIFSYWFISFCIWMILALVFLFQTYGNAIAAGIQPFLWVSAQGLFFEHLLWSVLTLPLIWIFNQLKSPFILFKFLLVIFLFAFLYGVIEFGGAYLILKLNEGQFRTSAPVFLTRWKPYLFNSIFYNMFVSIIICLIWYTWITMRKLQQFTEKNLELNTQLANTQLQMLRMQLNPHFIFNTFNTISMLIRLKKPSEAIGILSKLAQLLRSTLYKNQDNLVTIEEELAICREYLEIEAERFKDHLQIGYKVQSNCLKHKVPSLILQPLIENAFKHSFSVQAINKPSLLIDIFCNASNLHIKIENTGTLDLNKVSNSQGIGLQNIKRRLKLLYEDKAYFTITQVDDLVCAHIILQV